MLYRYSRWDGSQELDPLATEELMDSLAEEMMSTGDLQSVLRRLLRQGMDRPDGERTPGMQDVLEQLRKRRQEQLSRYDLDSMMDDIARRLEDIIQTERAGIQRRLDRASDRDTEPRGHEDANETGRRGEGETGGEETETRGRGDAGNDDVGRGPVPRRPAGEGQDGTQSSALSPQSSPDSALRRALERIANQKLDKLDQLPPDPAGQINELSSYDFMDHEARAKFDELMKMLQQQMLGNQFQGLKDSLERMTPQDMQALRDMVRDLNRMLQERQQGREPDFQSFMDKHGRFFPPEVQSLDDLIEHLQRRNAQMQSMLSSMSPEQRSSLQQMMDSLLQDDRLRWDMMQLAANLERLLPMREFQARYPFRGDESLTMQQAMQLMERLQQMDQLERELRFAQDPASLGQIDAERVREIAGPEAADQLEQLRRLMQLLEDHGYLERDGDDYQLTAKAIRHIGQKALRDIFGRLGRDAFGKHETEFRGTGGERSEDTKRYEFGDPFLVKLESTLMNSLVREGPGTPLKIQPDDFTVYRTELLTQSSIVLMVDMSRSMIYRGCFSAAKKVALALNSLIKSQYPTDNLYIVMFSEYAREVRPEALPQLSWDEEVYGTNLHHAFMLARHLLGRHKAGNRQIIVVTDGEPTAHLEDGVAYFAYPPEPRTLVETLKEVDRCTRDRITINTFMLDDSRSLVHFVDQISKINKGRAFFTSPDRLGEYILVDYVTSKRKRIA